MKAARGFLLAIVASLLAGPALAHDPRFRGHQPGWNSPWPGQVHPAPVQPWPGSGIGPRGHWEGSRQDWNGSFWRVVPQHPAERHTPRHRPPVVVVVPPPVVHWYCADPPGYYPNVPRCRMFWQQVPEPRYPW